jgi:hypothetical protein
MMRRFTHAADPSRPMPGRAGERLDGVTAAIASLDAEERRLARLGLDDAARACRQQRRYWQFLGALFSIPQSPAPALARRREPRWPIDGR